MRDTGGDAVISTERLILRRWAITDAVVQRELWEERDPRVPPHRRIDADGHPTVEDLERRINDADPEPRLGLLAVVPIGSDSVAGYCGLIANIHGNEDEPEIAYEFLRRWWGLGYATEASTAVLEWASRLGYRRVWSTVRDWNAPSHRVMQKLGFSRTQRVELDSTYGDVVYYVKPVS